MKKQFISFTTFSRIERLGLVALVALLMVLVTLRFTIHLFHKPADTHTADSVVMRRWTDYKIHEMANRATEDAVKKSTPHASANKALTTQQKSALNTIVDINTADSLAFRTLPGMKAKMIHEIIAWRNLHGDFTETKQIVQYCHVKEDVYNKIESRLTIGRQPHH